jgi:hypothetical protein
MDDASDPVSSMAAATHVTGVPALLHFARRQDVVAWPRLAGRDQRSVRNVTE